MSPIEGTTGAPPADEILSWLHICDLHITHAMSENLADLRRILALVNALPDGMLDFARIEVQARTADGQADLDRVEPVFPGWPAPRRFADGSDKGILGTQLGPNRNGRRW